MSSKLRTPCNVSLKLSCSLIMGMYLFLILLFSIPCYTQQLQTSHAHTLLRIQKLLNFPSVLNKWDNNTDFCNIEPTMSLTVVCYEDSITQLLIMGDNGGSSSTMASLPPNFSIDSFFTTLVRLPSLKVLSLVSLGLWGSLPAKISRLSSLEILNVSSNFLYGVVPEEVSSLRNLQTLMLDDNMFNGRVPEWMGEFPRLAVLSLRNNSFTGSLPNSLKTLATLRVIALSMNKLSGEVPDLSSLTHLQVLDLEDNYFGPKFPILASNLVRLVLRKNTFRSAIPDEVNSYYQLERLDVSLNRFVGPFPKSLLSLPSITYLNIAQNKFTGMLLENLSCNAGLGFVDLSSNLLTGNLPSCLVSDSHKNKVVRYASNCLSTTTDDQSQHPYFFCRNEALAVGLFSHKQNKSRRNARAILASIILGALFGGFLLVGLIFYLFVRRDIVKRIMKRPPTRLIKEKVSTGYTSKLLSDARYISQTMRLGALGLPAYRTFSLEELEEATNNFNTSTFLGEGSHGQMYKGRLNDGSFVAIRCLKLKKSHSTQNFMHHIDLISKLRHCHLVSALGHCFECYLDDSSVSRIFLVFEYVSNGTLRGCISDGVAGQVHTWIQRIAAAIGVAKGIQFLHTGIVPGVFSNNLKITDILLDQNLVTKISSYNLPLLTENMKKVGTRVSYGGLKEVGPSGTVHEDKIDIYDFGVILLEIIIGRPIMSKHEVDILKDQLQISLTTDDASRRNIVDPVICKACSDESLRTVMDICNRCICNEPTERPSIEDVLWNLQFAAQVQDEWKGDSSSSKQSPVSSSQLPSLQLTSQ
ncbi:hypothetical protein GIB67_031284 [Kingdonia uniflora]|uniref:Protein kinase domain-containing protein n=1 Tax=Kingdonia uniflora TaxID=39325 RepID=A0A7J7P5Z5_9MAGN|nr:hypothetical protein GIB67_031284 [Kingdonia uniflora]